MTPPTRNPFDISDLLPAEGTGRKLFDAVGGYLTRALGLQTLHDMYEGLRGRTDTENFLQTLFSDMRISFEIAGGSLDTLPKQGPVVVVSNHPFGLVEGCIMIELLRQRRPDARVMANFLLGRIPELKDRFILVDPFESSSSARRNIQPLKETLEWLKGGHALAVFPSGTVSHFHWRHREISDPVWSPLIGRLIRKSGASVLPMFFEGENSAFFQLMGLLHPRFRTLLLARQFINKQGRSFRIKVGNIVPAEKLSAFRSDEQMLAYLRLRTYLLSDRNTKHGNQATAGNRREPTKDAEPIVDAEDPIELVQEVARLEPKRLLIRSGDLEVYVARAAQIPHILREIGRLREITFRAVYEGTGKSLDLDRFDEYYSHLFLWNAATSEVIGAYRLARVDQVFRHFGKNGLYTSTLFNYRESLLRQLTGAVEVGRSFIRIEYQRNYQSLLLLWRGIGQFMVLNERYHTLFGPVSINNEYQSATRQLIISFLKANNYLPELARLLKARNPLPRKPIRGLDEQLMSVVAENVSDVDALVGEIEISQKGVPVLLRQYLKLGGKLLGFNVDKDFGGVLDGLILVDLRETQPRLLERYLGKEGAAKFLAKHRGTSSPSTE